MEAVHQVVNGRVLNRVIKLPKAMQDIFVEVTVKPAEEQKNPVISRNELRAKLKGSHTESLSGVIKGSKEMTLEEHRAERRSKYERAN